MHFCFRISCRSAIEVEESKGMSNITDDFYRDIWQTRMREIQGAIILASLSQVYPQN